MLVETLSESLKRYTRHSVRSLLISNYKMSIDSTRCIALISTHGSMPIFGNEWKAGIIGSIESSFNVCSTFHLSGRFDSFCNTLFVEDNVRNSDEKRFVVRVFSLCKCSKS